MVRMLSLNLLGVVAVLLGLATGVLALIFAVSPLREHEGVRVFPLAAGIVQICSSFISTALIIIRGQNHGTEKERQRCMFLLAIGLVSSLCSTTILGASLGWSESSIKTKAPPVLGVSASRFLTNTFAVWACLALANLVYWLAVAWVHKRTPKTREERLPVEASQSTPQEMVESDQTATITSQLSNPFHGRRSSSSHSLIHSDGFSSFRSSFSTTQRPSSSKKGFPLQGHSHNQRYQHSSSDEQSRRPSQDEIFDSWDTSAVSPQIRETILHSKPTTSKGSGLEPIPGSRSPSPAKALEGPFFQTSPSITPPTSPLPQPSVSQPNSPPISPLERPSDYPNFPAMFSQPGNSSPTTPRQYSISRPGTRSGPVSRSGSIAVARSRQGSRSRAPSEDHIHPLFRASSPTPPPSASAGTNVTAAPEAGQYIDERMLKRMRSGSLPTIPSPLVRSESSPDIHNYKVPPSPNVDTIPTFHTSDLRPDKILRPHQRKRSASFQGSVND